MDVTEESATQAKEARDSYSSTYGIWRKVLHHAMEKGHELKHCQKGHGNKMVLVVWMKEMDKIGVGNDLCKYICNWILMYFFQIFCFVLLKGQVFS